MFRFFHIKTYLIIWTTEFYRKLWNWKARKNCEKNFQKKFKYGVMEHYNEFFPHRGPHRPLKPMKALLAFCWLLNSKFFRWNVSTFLVKYLITRIMNDQFLDVNRFQWRYSSPSRMWCSCRYYETSATGEIIFAIDVRMLVFGAVGLVGNHPSFRRIPRKFPSPQGDFL